MDFKKSQIIDESLMTFEGFKRVATFESHNLNEITSNNQMANIATK